MNVIAFCSSSARILGIFVVTVSLIRLVPQRASTPLNAPCATERFVNSSIMLAFLVPNAVHMNMGRIKQDPKMPRQQIPFRPVLSHRGIPRPSTRGNLAYRQNL